MTSQNVTMRVTRSGRAIKKRERLLEEVDTPKRQRGSSGQPVPVHGARIKARASKSQAGLRPPTALPEPEQVKHKTGPATGGVKRADNTALLARVAELQQALDDEKYKCARLFDSVSQSETENKSLTEKCGKVAQELQAMTEKCLQKDKDIETLRGNLALMTEKCLQKDKFYKTTVVTMAKKQDETAEKCLQLSSTVAQKDHELEQCKVTQKSLYLRIDFLETKQSAERRLTEEWRAELMGKEDTIKDLTEKALQLEGKIKEKQMSLTQSRGLNDLWMQKYAALMEQHKNLVKDTITTIQEFINDTVDSSADEGSAENPVTLSDDSDDDLTIDLDSDDSEVAELTEGTAENPVTLSDDSDDDLIID